MYSLSYKYELLRTESSELMRMESSREQIHGGTSVTCQVWKCKQWERVPVKMTFNHPDSVVNPVDRKTVSDRYMVQESRFFSSSSQKLVWIHWDTRKLFKYCREKEYSCLPVTHFENSHNLLVINCASAEERVKSTKT